MTLQVLARSYATRTSMRVVIVIVNVRGRVLADTSPTETGTVTFASRPEIGAALGGAITQGSRYSQTLGQTLLYIAVPVASGGVVRGAVRVTYPTATGLVLGRVVRRPLAALAAAASSLGGGDLGARAAIEGPPETRALGLAFNQMASRLDELVRAQASFAADAAHELRTPLQALRPRHENLEGAVDESGRRNLTAAHAETQRLARLIDGLLALARAEDVARPDASDRAFGARDRAGRQLARARGREGGRDDRGDPCRPGRLGRERTHRAGCREPALERARIPAAVELRDAPGGGLEVTVTFVA